MNRIASAAVGLGLAACLMVFGSAHALPLIIDYTGFSWGPHGPGAPPASAPTQLYSVGVIDGFSLPVNLQAEVYTYYLSGLDLASTITHTPTRHTYIYSGGSLALYQSTGAANRAFAYGVDPFNGTVPSSFTDGLLWLEGGLTSFSFYYDDALQLGAMQAQGSFTNGSFASHLNGGDYFNFAGVTARSGNGIPQGYGYRLDGQLEAEARPVPEPATCLFVGLGLVGLAISLRPRRSS